jgi:DNA-binding FadR family transcriptional regulator
MAIQQGFTAVDSLPRKAAWQVAHSICEQIVKGDLVEGQPLPSETTLMSQYGVSRAVLREALRLLEWDSYISIRRGPSGGATVTVPDVRVAARYCGLLLQVQGAHLDDLDHALKVVEPEIVRVIARSRDRETTLLEQALDAEEHDPHPDRTAFVAAGREFHDRLPSAIGNLTLGVMLRIVREIRERHDYAALSGTNDEHQTHQRTISAHGMLVQLLREGESEAAAALWIRHLTATSRALAKTSAKTVLDLFTGLPNELDLMVALPGAPRRARLPKGSDIVARELRRRIVSKELSEGDSVPTERALMEQFGLSRPSVREALRILEGEHLVEPVRGRHSGGRARLPSLEGAAWQTGLLLQWLGCSVGDVLDAQELLERCSSEMLDSKNLPSVVLSLRGVLDRPDSGSESAVARIVDVLDLYQTLADQVGNRTIGCLSGIGRALIRQAVQGATPHLAGAASGAASALRDAGQQATRLLEPAAAGDVQAVIDRWNRDCRHFYRQLRRLVDVSSVLDMFPESTY